MRNLCTVFFILSCLILFFPNTSKASHLVGAEISWKYLRSDTFLISVTIERDCNGVPMPDQPFFIVPTGSNIDSYVNTIKTGGLDITPVCKNYCTRCSESSCDFPNGFENYIFSAKINLKAIDSNTCNFTIVWGPTCCRNGAITTGAAAEDYYLEATMNPCIKPGDNSPIFINPPLMLAEVGQCLSYTFAASDSDLDAYGFQDSLVYFLDNPYQAKNTPADFVFPYAFNHPILYYGTSPNDPWVPDCKGFHLDLHTGDLMFKATKQDITQVVVRVEEWGRDASRKPYKKGETRRDVTFFTMPATGDQVPSLSGFNGTTNYSENFCVGQKKCLTIYSADADTNNIIRVSSSGFPAGLSATLAIDTTTKTPKTVFCWNPDSTQVGKTYQFVLNATDNNCPLSGKTARTYTVNVFATPKASASATNLDCGNIRYNIIPQINIPILNYTWTGGDGLSDTGTSFIHHYHYAGIYRWTVLYTGNGGCSDTDGGNVIISNYVTATVSPRDTLVCLSNHPVLKLNLSATNGTGSYTYSWTSGGKNLNDSTPDLKVPVKQDSIIIANVLDNGSKCLNWDTVHISASGGVTPIKLIPPHDTLTCFGENVILTAGASGGDSSHYSFLWEPIGLKQNTYSFTATSAQSQLITASDGCSSDTATVHISIRAPLLVHMPKDTATCLGSSINVTASGSGGIPAKYIFTWEGSIGKGPTKSLTPTYPQAYRVVLSDGCSNPDTGLVYFAIHPIPISAPSIANTTVMQNQNIQFENASSGATQYKWKFGDSTTSDLVTPTHIYTDTGYFSINLIAISAFGCIDSTILKKYIHVLPAYYCYIPSAFTPNYDSLNDSFGPKGQAIKDFTIEIFSRYGNTIYKGNKNWDGTYKGQVLMDGMCYYYLIVNDIYGQRHTYFSHFYLLN